MAILPYPPAPEPGWYADDVKTNNASHPLPQPIRKQQPNGTPLADGVQPNGIMRPNTAEQPASSAQPSITARPATTVQSTGTMRPASIAQPASSARPIIMAQPNSTAQPNHTSPPSSAAQPSEAPHQFVLHNDTTGQNITVSRNTLLGRKPALNSLQGFTTARIDDPTRTTSRTHATLSIDDQGQLWIEDCDSLNGTYIIRNAHETQVPAGTPMRLDAPATIRLGDLFFELTQM